MFVTTILAKVREFLRYREPVRELSQLSDRELDDLGITRFQSPRSPASTRPRNLCCIAATATPAIRRAFA